jgi:hypothetical protein
MEDPPRLDPEAESDSLSGIKLGKGPLKSCCLAKKSPDTSPIAWRSNVSNAATGSDANMPKKKQTQHRVCKTDLPARRVVE